MGGKERGRKERGGNEKEVKGRGMEQEERGTTVEGWEWEGGKKH